MTIPVTERMDNTVRAEKDHSHEQKIKNKAGDQTFL
jgi:hypothetical protein